MKRFSARERNGMIVLACLVVIFLGGGMLLRVGGCTRGGYESFQSARSAVDPVDSVTADSARVSAFEEGGRLEGMEKTSRVKNRVDSAEMRDGKKSRRGSRSGKSGKKKEKENPGRRSLRLEPLD